MISWEEECVWKLKETELNRRAVPKKIKPSKKKELVEENLKKIPTQNRKEPFHVYSACVLFITR